MHSLDTPVGLRHAQSRDVPLIVELYRKVYPEGPHYSAQTLGAQIANFPEGAFVALREDQIVGYCATLRETRAAVWSNHTWKEITGGGRGNDQCAGGRWLYGYEIFVDPDCRRRGIGQRFYRARAELCRSMGLDGIAICGRLPQLRKRFSRLGSAQAYVKAALSREIVDPTFHFQLEQGFVFQRVIPAYLPGDEASMGYAAFMVWLNPDLLQKAAV